LEVLVTGVCETDFSGYPDCRDDTMKAMQLALSLGMDQRFLIETPLMWIDKAATWDLARRLGDASGEPGGGHKLVDLIVEHTHTCYLGDRSQRHAWGYGCGTCPACLLRAKGYSGFSDNVNQGDTSAGGPPAPECRAHRSAGAATAGCERPARRVGGQWRPSRRFVR